MVSCYSPSLGKAAHRSEGVVNPSYPNGVLVGRIKISDIYSMPVKIAIVDDKPSNRNILRDKLQSHALFSISFLAVDGEDFLQKMKALDETAFPEIVLMDLEMPNMDGVAAIAAGSALYPSVKFVVLTIFDDEEKIFMAIKAGANGYLLKDESSATLQDTLWQMHEIGSGPISPGIAARLHITAKELCTFRVRNG